MHRSWRSEGGGAVEQGRAQGGAETAANKYEPSAGLEHQTKSVQFNFEKCTQTDTAKDLGLTGNTLAHHPSIHPSIYKSHFIMKWSHWDADAWFVSHSRFSIDSVAGLLYRDATIPSYRRDAGSA